MIKVISSETYQRRATTCRQDVRAAGRATASRSLERSISAAGRSGETGGRRRRYWARLRGTVDARQDSRIAVRYEEREEREYTVPAAARIRVEDGAARHAGEQLTEGSMNPQDILRIQGREAVQRYLVDEVQKVYRSQGVNINDKHIEIIVRQMLRKLRVDHPGDTELLPGELVDRFEYEDKNRQVLAEGGEPATAMPVLLGVTKASLNTESFLAAASFQETTRCSPRRPSPARSTSCSA